MGWGEWDVQEWVGGAVGGMMVYRFSGYTSNEDCSDRFARLDGGCVECYRVSSSSFVDLIRRIGVLSVQKTPG